MRDQHTIFDGRIHIYKRDDGRYWQCSACIKGTNYRASTKEDSLALAKEFAEDWYLELRGKLRRGELVTERKFRAAAEQFLREYEIITEGQRSPRYVKGHRARLKNYLLPFFGDMGLSEITAGKLQEYRIWRLEKNASQRQAKPADAAADEEKATEKTEREKGPARSTIHQEIVVLRQVLKTAVRHKWLDAVPDLSEPYRASTKIAHRAWFTPEEYKKLYEATRRRAINPLHKRFQWQAEQLHDYVLFMANTGLRPDEAARLEYRDVKVVFDHDSQQKILEIEVRGKRGVGYCKSMPGAVTPFRRLQKRNTPKPTDRIFKGVQSTFFNRVLIQEDLKFDREGQVRTPYSLRHTYICFRLMEGADIYQVAKNCRTSVEMIEKYYASHLKTTIDASAVNVRKARIRKVSESEGPEIRP
jgi:integrase